MISMNTRHRSYYKAMRLTFTHYYNLGFPDIFAFRQGRNLFTFFKLKYGIKIIKTKENKDE